MQMIRVVLSRSEVMMKIVNKSCLIFKLIKIHTVKQTISITIIYYKLKFK